MAIVWLEPPEFDVTISVAGDYQLPPAVSGVVSRYYIRGVSSSFSGSITIKARPAGSADTFVAVEYYLVASEDAATAALTDSFWIWVDGTGRDIDIDATSVVSGSMAVSCIPVIG